MKTVERAVQLVYQDIAEKNIIEIACGCAEFSVAASQHAQSVACIALDKNRLCEKAAGISNLSFQKMDAGNTSFTDNAFDTVILYNAIGYLYSRFPEVLRKSFGICKKEGKIISVSTFKIDRTMINERVIPYLTANDIPFTKEDVKKFTVMKICPPLTGART